MKVYDIKNISLGVIEFEKAVELAQSSEVLSQVHDNFVIVQEWRHHCRKFQIDIKIENAPIGIKQLLNSDTVKATVTEKIIELSKTKYDVRLHLKLHIFGAELLKIRPRIVLTKDCDTQEVFLSSRVEVHAVFPPPMDALTETFMIGHAEKYITYHTDMIKQYILKMLNPTTVDDPKVEDHNIRDVESTQA